MSTFYFANGRTANSVPGLVDVLRTLDESTFKHHCNKERNDFYSWIAHLGEFEAANSIKRVKSRKTLIRKLSA
jgi:hypothetical protein